MRFMAYNMDKTNYNLSKLGTTNLVVPCTTSTCTTSTEFRKDHFVIKSLISFLFLD